MATLTTNGIELIDAATWADDLQETLHGLSRTPKTLSCKFFYDKRGSELFEKICALPEYYVTRTEQSIMDARIESIAAALGPRCLVIEFGSGSSIKTTLLLDHLEDPVGYVPIDISREHLIETAGALAVRYPGMDILPVCVDFHQEFLLPEPSRLERRRVVYFPGSTIGNFEEAEARRFLDRVARLVGPEGGLLIGIDMRKDESVLLPAYDDSEGVTAEFNLNMLVRINRDLGADFNVEQFRHLAIWNDRMSRMEMYLESVCRQDVTIRDRTFQFERGERIRTEYSHKYTLEQFGRLAGSFRMEAVWTDRLNWFSVLLLQPCLESIHDP